MNICCLLYGPNEHHIDHIAALAGYFNLPLALTEKPYLKLLEKYYPHVVTYHLDYNTVAPLIMRDCSGLISCLPKAMIREIFFMAENFSGKEIPTIWCPHGNSPKGFSTYFSQALSEEETILYYGEEMLKELKGTSATTIPVGNYRYEHYLHHKIFYDAQVNDEVFKHLEPKKKNVLYAPTWDEFDQVETIIANLEELINTVCSLANLIIKLHPNTKKLLSAHFAILREKYESCGNVLILDEFPPIYPLLNKTDIFIGDRSSVGYDFLKFNRPMLFTNAPNEIGELYSKETFLKALTEGQEALSSIRGKAYAHKFAVANSDIVRKKLIEIFRRAA